jgi:hypothetical protein
MTDRSYTTIDGHRVKVAERRLDKTGKSDGLEPSHGYKANIKTPWGAWEQCYVVTTPGLSGEKERYASVYRPVTNPGVRWSVFQIDSDNVAFSARIN